MTTISFFNVPTDGGGTSVIPQNDDMAGTYQTLELQRFAPSVREGAVVVDHPWRTPAAGEIAVRNLCCGVNGIFDTQIARNAVDYVRVALPTVMGVEALGVVTAVGDGVSGFSPGDSVVTVRFRGGYREGNVGPASDFVKVAAPTPEWLALASTGVSAWLALDHVGQAKAGETVAISAAAGGLGHLLVQLAKLRGCRVVAVCGGPVKAAFVKGLGADHVIDYKAEPVAEALARDFPNALDLAIDTVGGSTFDAFVDQLAPHGRLVVGGAAQDLDGKPEVVTGPRIVHKLYYKGASVRGFMNGLLTAHWAAARAALFPLYESGRLKVVIDAEPFEGVAQVADAVEHLLAGRSMGKVVVRLQGPSSRRDSARAPRLPVVALLAAALFTGAAGSADAQAAPAVSPFAGARFTQVIGGGGVPLNVVDKGDPALPAVLFIHGFRQSYLSWSLQFGSDLSTRCRLVALDLRGHGNSGSPWVPEAYNHSRPWADDIAQVIKTLGLKKPLVVGWSFGGNVAMDFASHYPAVPVSGYLLTGTAGGTQASPPPPAAPASAPPRASASPDLGRNIAAVEASMKVLFPNPALDPALLAQFAAAAMRVGPWVDQAVAGRPRSPAIALAQPITFATGGKDPLVGAATVARLKDFFPNPRLVDFPQAGHAVFLDEPERFNALIDELQCAPPRP